MEGSMKKILLFFLFCCFVPPTAHANDSVFNTGEAFSLAKAVKLGRGKTSSFNEMNALNVTSELLKNCDPDCISDYCDRNSGTCSRCLAGKFIYNNKCLSCPSNATCNGVTFTCKNGYYKNSTQCSPCTDIHDKCISCSNGSTCLTCEQNYVLKDNICYVKKECSEYCEECDYTTGKCLRCDSTSELQSDGTCKLLCPTAEMCVEEFGGKESDWTIKDCECEATKKYIILSDQSISYAGRKLYRIKAMQDISFTYERKRAVQKQSCGNNTIYDDTKCRDRFGMTCSAYYQAYHEWPTEYSCYDYTTYETYDSVPMSVKKGELGGYIEKESNLSTSKSDKGWVSGSAKVYGDGKVSGAWVTDQAVVSGGSVSYGAYVYDNAKIPG